MFESRENIKAIAQKVAIRTEKRRKALEDKQNEERERRLMGFSLEAREAALQRELNVRLALGSRRGVECLRGLIEETREAQRREAARKQKGGFLRLLFGD